MARQACCALDLMSRLKIVLAYIFLAYAVTAYIVMARPACCALDLLAMAYVVLA